MDLNKIATSRDVAMLAGVSQATVSRAFSSKDSLSPDTRQKVMDAARMLNYHPNALARSLVLAQSNFIGIVKGYSPNVIFNEMLSEMVYILQRMDKRVIYFESEKGQRIDDLVGQIMRYQIEGLVVMYSNLTSELTANCRQRDIPVLQMHRHAPSSKTNAVLPDNFKAAADAATLFVNKGFRNFVYLAGDINSSSNMERQLGFFRRLREYGYPDPVICRGEYTYESGMTAIREIGSKLSLPCGILCGSDLMALGAIDVLKYELGLKVGKDVAVVGFDNLYMGEWPSYSLTTFAQPIAEMARDGLDLLFANITNKNMPPVEKRYPLKLIERDSTNTN